MLTFILNMFFYANLITRTSCQIGQAPVVYTTLGPVMGQQFVSPGGTRVNGYLSVPYADQPQRFARPTPRTPWTNVFNGSEFGAICYQDRFGPTQRPLSEDCLFLKILVPVQPLPRVLGQRNLFPIIYWAPGGGFTVSNNAYDIMKQADVIVSRGVIMVQPNFHPQTYGFWSTGQSDAPGNYAFWDMLEGLRFLRANALNFGGDPNRIVLAGQGAGAVAADALSLSPLTRGLWSALIMLSGSVFNPQVNLAPDVQLRRYRQMATYAGCDDVSGTLWNSGRRAEILTCMRNKDPSEIVQAETDNNLGSFYYGPRVDGYGGFFPMAFEVLARQRPNTPVFTGSLDDEYAWDLIVTPGFRTGRAELPPNINSMATVTNTCNRLVTEETFPRNYQQVRASCIQKYRTNGTTANQPQPYGQYQQNRPPQQQGQLGYLQNAIRAGSGMVYWAPLMKDVAFMLQNGNYRVYLYSFDYSRPQAGDWWREAGSFHNYDIFFIENFIFPFYNYTMEAPDQQLVDMWSEFFGNFAKLGVPAPPGLSRYRWNPTGGLNYFSFNAPTSTEANYYHVDDVYFWTVQTTVL